MDNESLMGLAIEEARKGIENHEGGPFGCVIAKDGEVVGRGHNTVLKEKDPTCHGEIMAIHDACKRLNTFNLSGCVLFTTSYPCPMCLGAILWANIKTVYYACSTEDAERIGFRDKAFYENKHALSLKELRKADGERLFAEYQSSEHEAY
jgi:guanine deaminase